MKTYQIILLVIVLWCLVPHIILWSLDLKASLKRKASLVFLDAAWRGVIDMAVGFAAPVIVPIALLFTKWESERLPSAFRAFDNDLNLNGDPHGYDGKVLIDRKSTRLNSSHSAKSRMPSSA